MDNLSPEDREILAKTKFKQWYQECFDETFGTSFDKRLTEISQFAESGTTPPTRETKEEPANNGGKKRSLLTVALSDAMGIG